MKRPWLLANDGVEPAMSRFDIDGCTVRVRGIDLRLCAPSMSEVSSGSGRSGPRLEGEGEPISTIVVVGKAFRNGK